MADILNPRDRNARVVQQAMVQAAVHDALENGVPVPVVDARPVDDFYPLPDANGRAMTRWAVVRPFFRDEDRDSEKAAGFWLPAYRRNRHNGFAYTFDGPGLRPFLQGTCRLHYTHVQDPGGDQQEIIEEEYLTPFRAELPTTEFHPDRILEITRTTLPTWAHLRASDMEAFQAFVQESVEGTNELVLQGDIEALVAEFVKDLQAAPCPLECEKGFLRGPKGEKQGCPDCFYRGRSYSDDSSTENEAGTEGGGLVSPSGAPLSSSD